MFWNILLSMRIHGILFEHMPICCLVLYNPSEKLVFMPVASAKAGTRRDPILVACSARRLEI